MPVSTAVALQLLEPAEGEFKMIATPPQWMYLYFGWGRFKSPQTRPRKLSSQRGCTGKLS